MIKDSRQMYGYAATTPEEVRAAWSEYVAEKFRRGQVPFAEDAAVTGFRHSDKRLRAYINEGRWVADCPRCNSGIAVWVGMPDAACYDCGRVFSDIKFPKEAERLRAENVLLKRESLTNMCWDPDTESVADLKAENALQGVDATDAPVQPPVDDVEPYIPPELPSTPDDDIVPPAIPPPVIEGKVN